ncbi:hypothetical protein GW846_02045 [Candidatus Gracilibacteria bacterium]|nr:hypothetical protein [Candidatus Gracilibacteria bacterium]
MLKNSWHIIILILGILIINLFPSFFLLLGTYFLLDTGFAPFTEFRGFFEVSIFGHLTHLLSYLLGYALFSKLFFVFVILVGITTGLLISKYIGTTFPQFRSKTLDIAAIIAAVYNPFMYERLISQTGIAFGSYMLIIGILIILICRARPCDATYDYHRILKYYNLGILSMFPFAVAWMIFPHAILLIVLILTVLTLMYPKNIIQFMLILFGVILLNINWLVGDYALRLNTNVSKLESFTRDNIEVFQGNSLSGLGVDLTHLFGYGFWGEKYHIISPDDIMKYWYIFAILVLTIVVYGGYKLYIRDKYIAIVLSSIAVIAYILSMGIASPIWGWSSEILYEYLPFYIGMREPQKWLALTQGIYMIYFVIGSMYLLHSKWLNNIQENIFKRLFQYLVKVFIVVLPILWVPTMLIGFWGQLNISDYPDDIFEAREFVQTKIPADSKIINFPWHSYMACDWTYGKVTANRAKDLYYPANIVTSDNIEIGKLYSNSVASQSIDINKFVNNKDINLLIKNRIEYVLFNSSCADWRKYMFLEEDTVHYEKLFDSEHIKIYKVKNEK